MRGFCTLIFAAFVAGWMSLPTAVPAGDFPETLLEDRSPSARVVVAPVARSGSAAFEVELDSDDAGRRSFGLFMPGDYVAGSGLTINGEPLGADPIVTDIGQWYLVPEGNFLSGGNLVVADGLTAPVEVTVFPLEEPFETDHFGLFTKSVGTRAQPPVDPRQELMDVLHCTLDVTLDMTAATIPEATLELTARSLDSSLTECVLDLDRNNGSLTVSSVDSGEGTPALTFTHTNASNRVVIDLPAAVPEGEEFTVRVQYSGTPRSGRGFRRSTRSGIPTIYTNNQPYDGRTWIPLKDIPADKFTIDLNITVPDTLYSGYPLTPVSNGALLSVTDNGNGTKTFHWSEGYPVASYLISIACSNYRPASGIYTALDGVTEMEVAHYVYPESYAAESPEVPNTIEIVEFFAELFGEYPFLDEKYYTATWGLNFGMEHQTCTSMPNLQHQNPYTRRSIHEVVHMWFGDMVTYHTYEHLWIAEGWATYGEALFYEHLNGVNAYHSYVNNWSVSDARPIVSANQDAFDSTTLATAYRKGGWVLHMLRKVMGDEDFFGASAAFLHDAAFQHGTADSVEYEQFYSDYIGGDLSWFFDQWLYRAGRPNYQWSWSASSSTKADTVTVSISQTQAGDVYTMPIDFDVVYSGGSRHTFTVFNDQRIQTFVVPVPEGTIQSVEFDPLRWVLQTNQQVNPSGPPANAPALLVVEKGAAAGTADLAWESAPELGIDGFRVYTSPDGIGSWTLRMNESALNAGTTSAVLDSLPIIDDVYIRIAAVRDNQVGPYSAVYGVQLAGVGQRILVVDGNERWITEGVSGGLNHNFTAAHGRAISAWGAAFDSCSNRALGGAVDLGDYSIVVWHLGNESTVDKTFDAIERAMVEDYLQNGGALFVSGNEVGWDLGRSGVSTTAELEFYNTFLKAVFGADDSGSYTVNGVGGDSIFFSDVYTYGSGDAPYTPGWPDEVEPNAGGVTALNYATNAGAGVQYFGLFPGGTEPGALVYLGFSFETVSSESEREQMMARVLDAFQGLFETSAEQWLLY